MGKEKRGTFALSVMERVGSQNFQSRKPTTFVNILNNFVFFSKGLKGGERSEERDKEIEIERM